MGLPLAPAAPGMAKEVLVTSGLDIWFKRPSYPIADRWPPTRAKRPSLHRDEGEGPTCGSVGRSRGAGGSGIWKDGQLCHQRTTFAGACWPTAPCARVFESWTTTPGDAGGVQVSETKRFTIDAGQQFYAVESTFTHAQRKPNPSR